MQALTKRPLESRLYTFAFTRFNEFLVSGETITSFVSITGASDLTVGSPSFVTVVDGGVTFPLSGVQVRISGGTDQKTYEMECTVITSGSNELTCEGTLYVGRPRTQ